jgi:hypothetical protein
MFIKIEFIVVLLGALLTALGFLFVLIMNAFSKNTEAFNSINESIQSIRIWMAKKDTTEAFENKACNTTHIAIQDKFRNHESRICKLEQKP